MFLLLMFDRVVSLNSFSFRFVVFAVSALQWYVVACTPWHRKYVSSNQFAVCCLRAGGCACGRNPISEFWNCRATLLCASSILSQYIASSNEWGIYNRKYHVKHVRQQISPQLSQVSMSSRKRDNFSDRFFRFLSLSSSCFWYQVESAATQILHVKHSEHTETHTQCGSWYRKCFVCSQWGCISWCTGAHTHQL